MSITHLLNQSITVYNPTDTLDAHGKKTFSTGVSLKARFERKYRTIVNANKESVPIQGVFIVGPDTAVEVGAKVVYDSENYRVLIRNDAPKRNGQIHHYELLCQLWSYA